MRITSLGLLAILSLSIVGQVRAQEPRHDPSPQAIAFLEQHCASCHDADSREADLDVMSLNWQATCGQAFESRVRMFERVGAGEMPPMSEAKPDEESKAAFQSDLKSLLNEQDLLRIANEGRAMNRRLNRDEYENSLRDVLNVPWIQIRDMLPEDGERYRYNKIGEALDVSHVQLSRNMSAAEHALQQALIVKLQRPEKSKKRYYARDEFSPFGRVELSGPEWPSSVTEEPPAALKAQDGIRSVDGFVGN